MPELSFYKSKIYKRKIPLEPCPFIFFVQYFSTCLGSEKIEQVEREKISLLKETACSCSSLISCPEDLLIPQNPCCGRFSWHLESLTCNAWCYYAPDSGIQLDGTNPRSSKCLDWSCRVKEVQRSDTQELPALVQQFFCSRQSDLSCAQGGKSVFVLLTSSQFCFSKFLHTGTQRRSKPQMQARSCGDDGAAALFRVCNNIQSLPVPESRRSSHRALLP